MFRFFYLVYIPLEESIEYISKKLDIKSPILLFNIIEKENNNLSRWKIENYPKMSNLGNPQKILNTCREYGFYLGLFLFNAEEYIYDWVKNIIRNESGEEIMAKRKPRKKKNIPKVLKDQVWDKYIGETIGKAKCICCKRILFHRGVKVVREKLLSFLEKHDLLKYVNTSEEMIVDDFLHICHSCQGNLLKKNMPQMSFFNGLGVDYEKKLMDLPALGKQLIAKTLVFIKFRDLPKSGMKAMNDR